MEAMMTSLADLQPGQRARIDELQGDPALVQRILEMGLTEDEEVTIVRFAPLGGPLEVRVRGYNLSLRRAEAARIQVTLL